MKKHFAVATFSIFLSLPVFSDSVNLGTIDLSEGETYAKTGIYMRYMQGNTTSIRYYILADVVAPTSGEIYCKIRPSGEYVNYTNGQHGVCVRVYSDSTRATDAKLYERTYWSFPQIFRIPEQGQAVAGLRTYYISMYYIYYPADSSSHQTNWDVTFANPEIPSAPSSFDVSEQSSSIKISWSAVSGAAKYRLTKYCNSSYVTKWDLTSTSKVDSDVVAGSTYYYKLQALNDFDLASETVTSKSIAYKNYYTVYFSGCSYSSRTIYSDDAFKVSRPTKSGYTFAGWTFSSSLNTSTAKWGTSSSPSTSISSTSTKIGADNSYVYFRNLVEIQSSITLTANWTPNPKYSVSFSGCDYAAIEATQGVAFKVSAPTKAGYTFAGWTVSSGLNTSTAKWGTGSSPTTAIASTTTKCGAGKSYVYFLNLTSTDGGSVTLTANWEEIVPLAPKVSAVSNTGGALNDPSIGLAWGAVANAASYNVYRSVSEDGTKTLVKSGCTVTNYLDYAKDSGLASGKKYWYWVTALNSNGTASEFSDSAWGYIPISFSVSPLDCEFGCNGGSIDVSVCASTSWSLVQTPECGWLSVQYTGQAGLSTLKLTASSNGDMQQRVSTVLITAGADADFPEIRAITVRQAPCGGAFALGTSTIRFDGRTEELIASGVEMMGTPSGASVAAWDTTTLDDDWKTLTSESQESSVLVLNDVAVEGGRLTNDVTWTAKKTHVVRHDVIVSSGVTLTIDFDSIVKLASGTRIWIEQGGRICAKGCYVTDLADDSVGGDTNHDGESFAIDSRWWDDPAEVEVAEWLKPSATCVSWEDAGLDELNFCDADDSDLPPRVYLTTDETILVGTLPTPVREGYNFLGWYTGQNGMGSEVTAGTPITEVGMDIYAAWEEAETLPTAPELMACYSFSSGPYLYWQTNETASVYGVFRSTTDDPNDALCIKWLTNKRNYSDTTAVGGVDYYYWVAASNAAGIVFSDSKSAYRQPTVSFTPSTVYIAFDGAATNVTVSANAAWTVSTDTEWITLTTTSGTGYGKLLFAVDANTEFEQQIGVVTVIVAGDTAHPKTNKFNVVLAAKPASGVALQTAIDCNYLPFAQETSALGVPMWTVTDAYSSATKNGTALKVSGLSAGQWASVRANVTGPCWLSWKWACVTNTSSCQIQLYCDGSYMRGSNNGCWGTPYIYLGEGTHLVDWRFYQIAIPSGGKGGFAVLDNIAAYYMVDYDGDGAVGMVPPHATGRFIKVNDDDSTNYFYAVGAELTLPTADALTYEGRDFDGWVCDNDGETYQPGDAYTVPTTSTVFRAKWTVRAPVYVEIEKPLMAAGLVYNGDARQGVTNIDARLSLRDGTVSATDAYEYAATFALPAKIAETNFVWKGETDVVAKANDLTIRWLIAKRAITLTSASDSKTWDGTPLVNDAVSVTEGSFVVGEGFSYTVTGSQTDVGSSTNAFTFVANPGTKIGNYNVTKIEGVLTVTATANPKPDWKAVVKTTDIALRARIYDLGAGAYLEDADAMLAAFASDGECRGVTTLMTGPKCKMFQMKVNLNEASESDFTLKYWSPRTGILDVNETFDGSSDIGTILAPVTYNVGGAEIDIELDEGWNWISIPVVPDDASIGAVFADCTFANGDSIMAGVGMSTYYAGNWYSGDLFSIVPGAAYRVKSSSGGSQTLTVTGEEMTGGITLSSGWNWVGSGSIDAVDMASLIHSGGFADEDEIRSGSGLSSYFGGVWYSSDFDELLPGFGYRVHVAHPGVLSSGAALQMSATSTLPASYSLLRTQTSAPDWTVVTQPYDFAIFCKVTNATSCLDADGSILAAFTVNGECRGKTAVMTVPGLGKFYQLKVCTATTAEKGFVLKLWNAADGKTYTIDGTFGNGGKDYGTFVSPVTVGTVVEKPFPDPDPDPTPDKIHDYLDGSVDDKLQANITNSAGYSSFLEWADKVKSPDGSSTVGRQGAKDSPHAWLSYALGTDKLIAKEPEAGDVKVDKFEPKNEKGKFDFTVSVKDVEVGSSAAAENLKQVFGLEGGTSLDGNAMSSANVNITFGTPENGKVKFTAGPKDADAGSFFMRVKMTP